MPSMKRQREEDEHSCSDTIRIAVGSYEHILQGLDAKLTIKDGKCYSIFSPVWSFEAHTGAIKALGCGGRYLASGGVDEVIKLYDLRRRRDLGSLLSHDGTITSIAFPEVFDEQPQHMLSCDENNKIIIWRIKDWSPLIQLTTRHGRVNDISIHPTGKIALSVGSDCNVRLWNLVTGKKAAAHSLIIKNPKGARRENCEGLKVAWNTVGDGYAILFDESVRLYDMSAELKHKFTAGKTKCHDMTFDTLPGTGQEVLFIALDDGKVHVLDTASCETIHQFKAHQTRVKCLTTHIATPAGASQEMLFVITTSTNGELKIWTISEKGWYLVGEHNCASARITCLVTADAIVEDLEEVLRGRQKKSTKEESDVEIKSESDDAALSEAVEEEFLGFD